MKVSCQTRRELLRVSVWQLFPDMRGDGSYQILRFFQWPPPQLPAATASILVSEPHEAHVGITTLGLTRSHNNKEQGGGV
ncbi:hypothetical protein O3P69_012674 [Scylla paramamosain]|uniref:Uncharacterized protein n=1 Tax=Scylla paramamosain TaxID=85552 RepID=A0AAW0SF15_SCYPA